MKKADVTIINALRQVSLFAGLSEKELAAVARSARDEVYSPGQNIVTEGAASGPVFAIVSGRANVVVDGHNVATLGPGKFFGEMAMVEGQPRSATVRAETHIRAVAFSPYSFGLILTENWKVTSRLLAHLSAEVRVLTHAVA